MVQAALRSGRSAESVRLLAVTKGFAPEIVNEAMALGLREFGESRVQEAEAKIAEVGPGPRWHLVGHLQTNKAKRAVQLFEVIHSVDSDRLAEELDRRAAAEGRSPLCYVEINTTGEASKHGVPPGRVPSLLERMRSLSSLRPAGLMTIGPLEGGSEGARTSFRLLAELRREAQRAGTLGPDAGLSMGMSGDYEIAIEEGATVVRIGTALLGDRPA
jgi:PLP dependent protein